MCLTLTTQEANLIHFADAVIAAAVDLGVDDAVAAAMPKTWAQGIAALNSDQASDQYMAYRLLLTAIARTPGAAQTLIETVAIGLAGRHGA